MKNSTKSSLKKYDDNKRLVKTSIIENSKEMFAVVGVSGIFASIFRRS